MFVGLICTALMCAFSCAFSSDLCPQISQVKFFIPVCVCRCVRRLVFQMNLLGHLSHIKGSRFVCLVSCFGGVRGLLGVVMSISMGVEKLAQLCFYGLVCVL